MAGMAKALTLSFSSSSSRNLILWPHHHLPIPNWSWRRKRTPTMAMAKVVPAVIVGSGRVGRALQEMGNGQDLVVKRGQSVPLDFVGPILVCTRNDDLDAVLQATPPSRWNDLVFFQNGMLEPWLNSKGLSDAEQVLAYFAVSKLGETPVDGKTDTNPEGLTAAYGKWAPAVAARLHAAALSCKVLDKEAFQKQMLEKLIWISAFMLVGARHPGATVGVVEKEYRSELQRKVWYLMRLWRIDYVRTPELLPIFLRQLKSSSGGMVGSTRSQRRQLHKENLIHVAFIQRGCRN
ncbi:uncharacterized protein LOC142636492 isoform X3 [Castanea sativa]|uniref:uncharacterized protein LOC142636492 isoform X3 n=1 Tax=Castanea sativa TaxID=21020 RepID=UPI003F64C220